MLKGLRKLDAHELVDINEISSRLRVSPRVIHTISYQEDTSFPRPAEGCGKRRVWQWFEILDWYIAHRIVRGRTDSHIPLKSNRYNNQTRAFRRAG